MDVILTLHAEHEFNASTFAARVAVATLADLHAAIVAALATLKGPRHGGANEDVLLMLQEIEDPARAEAFIESRLGARAGMSRQERADPRVRVPGFGHRVYRVDDARARVLRGMAKSMAEATGRRRLFEVAERVYDAMKARTGLPVNVDFFSAVVYDAARDPTRPVHLHLRRRARSWLVRPRARAVCGQPSHPAAGALRRAAPPAPRPQRADGTGSLRRASAKPRFLSRQASQRPHARPSGSGS